MKRPKYVYEVEANNVYIIRRLAPTNKVATIRLSEDGLWEVRYKYGWVRTAYFHTSFKTAKEDLIRCTKERLKKGKLNLKKAKLLKKSGWR